VEIQKSIVVYDGECLLCSSLIQFIRKRDKHKRFLFLSNQSNDFKKIQEKQIIPISLSDSILFLSVGHTFDKSDACIEIMKNIGGFWKLIVLFKLVPKILRDYMYDFVARNRYRFFGKKNQCVLPIKES
jgi:predicted DCC family thiol-disulfide oxidoreductase YuxK